MQAVNTVKYYSVQQPALIKYKLDVVLINRKNKSLSGHPGGT